MSSDTVHCAKCGDFVCSECGSPGPPAPAPTPQPKSLIGSRTAQRRKMSPWTAAAIMMAAICVLPAAAGLSVAAAVKLFVWGWGLIP